jgi:hypothetical protein
LIASSGNATSVSFRFVTVIVLGTVHAGICAITAVVRRVVQ